LKAVGYFVEPSAVLDFVEEDNHFNED
jgi:hypothetical protein